MRDKSKVTGVIYPIFSNFIEPMFKLKRNVFVKFIPREPTRKTNIRIKKGTKLYFYESGGGRCIIGDAKISSIEYLFLKEVIRKYRKKLIVPEKELRKYSSGREQKKLQVLNLNSLKRYKKPIELKKPITMAGRYITSKTKRDIPL